MLALAAFPYNLKLRQPYGGQVALQQVIWFPALLLQTRSLFFLPDFVQRSLVYHSL